MEQSFERLLNISTSGNQKNFNEFIHYNTPASYVGVFISHQEGYFSGKKPVPH